MKKNRQEKLLELISENEIDTQDELIELLRDNGYDVTQATVSRDIRELKIAKMTTGKGTYRYVLPKQAMQTGTGMNFSTTLIESVVSVDHAYAGLAGAVAVGIDGMNMPQVLGCVAGDDTIMIVSRNEVCATEIADHILSMKKAL